MSANDIVETFPDGSILQIQVPVLEVLHDGSYVVQDYDGYSVRLAPVEGTQPLVQLPPGAPAEPPAVIPNDGDAPTPNPEENISE